tara:strand:+ start:580 stop:735 length:156 start_codon:yes stop_codon:yes gene_type:complete
MYKNPSESLFPASSNDAKKVLASTPPAASSLTKIFDILPKLLLLKLNIPAA